MSDRSVLNMIENPKRLVTSQLQLPDPHLAHVAHLNGRFHGRTEVEHQFHPNQAALMAQF